MNLKQIALIPIVALSLSGSLYGMQQQRDGYGRLTYFPGLENITCENPGEFFNMFQFSNAQNHLEKIKLIVQKNPDIVNTVNPNGYVKSPALDYAIDQNNSDLVEIFLQHGKNVQINNTGRDRLHDAISIDCMDDSEVNHQKQIIHLLCSAGVTMESGDNQPYKEDSQAALAVAERYGNDEIVEIIKNHINTRLQSAIYNGNADETRRIITKYNIDINASLSSYNYYGATKDPYKDTFIPLHMAASYQKHEIVCMLVNDFNADVHSRDIYGKNAFFGEPLAETVRFLISKGGTPKVCSNEGQRPLDTIRWALTPEGLNELGNDPERIANLRALEEIFEGRSNNPWKLIGGGAAIVVVCVAAKKLYNWWYKEVEVEEEKSETNAENNEAAEDTIKDKVATQV